jgi:hypothetical protein
MITGRMKRRGWRAAAWGLLATAVLVGGVAAMSLSRSAEPDPHHHLRFPLTQAAVPTPAKLSHPRNANPCANNMHRHEVLVSIRKRTLWACSATHERYHASVITGIEYIDSDLTPTGSYRISAKHRNVVLSGSDSTGSWNDHVHYWMPFLVNEYGTYGLHDANWRKAGQFGAIGPNSAHASHGCVEMPLIVARWIYHWVHVGTIVTITK